MQFKIRVVIETELGESTEEEILSLGRSSDGDGLIGRPWPNQNAYCSGYNKLSSISKQSATHNLIDVAQCAIRNGESMKRVSPLCRVHHAESYPLPIMR